VPSIIVPDPAVNPPQTNAYGSDWGATDDGAGYVYVAFHDASHLYVMHERADGGWDTAMVGFPFASFQPDALLPGSLALNGQGRPSMAGHLGNNVVVASMGEGPWYLDGAWTFETLAMPIDNLYVEPNPTRVPFMTLAYDRAGAPHVVYVAETPYYVPLHPATVWHVARGQTPTVVALQEGYVAMQLDSTGTPYVVNSTNVSRSSGSAWQSLSYDNSAGTTALNPLLEFVDGSGNVCVGNTDSAGTALVATCFAGATGTSQTLASTATLLEAAAVGADGGLKVLVGRANQNVIVDARTGMVERVLVPDAALAQQSWRYLTRARMVVTSTGTRVIYYGSDGHLHISRC
jgi:hypothetical protein